MQHPSAARQAMRDKIVEAARDLYFQGGDEAASMRRIGQRLGVSAAALYGYFADRDEILAEMWLNEYANLQDRQRAIAARIADPVERIVALARDFSAFAREEPAAVAFMFLRRAPFRDMAAVLDDPRMAESIRLYKVSVAEAVALGRFPPISIDLLVQGIWAAGLGVLALRDAKPNLDWVDQDAAVEHAIQVHIEGLRVMAARSAMRIAG
ncbi:TetR/AcrR family transcriptional regulator [Zavarzinia sp. CC-PAN008]|uniref:TetR/AcrR family transcriptional regulator n=1 Tax=Zavarzinia sp. CC-PAN008 TaxID=3243332 RepID=UPI003F7488E0